MADTFQSRTAALTFLDSQYCHFFVQVGNAPGGDRRELPREETFCDSTFSGQDTLVVTDARRDARFARLDMVSRPDGYRFYAGTALVTPEGHPIGTLCVFDTVPRIPTAEQLAALSHYSAEAMALLERRRTGSANPFPPPPSPRRTVLVVDDEQCIREYVCTVLGLRKVATIEAANGAEALAAYREHRSRIGLVLTDLNMPVLGGLDLVRVLRTEPDAPALVVMSGRLDGAAQAALKAEKVDSILPKPFSGSHLTRVLELLPK